MQNGSSIEMAPVPVYSTGMRRKWTGAATIVLLLLAFLVWYDRRTAAPAFLPVEHAAREYAHLQEHQCDPRGDDAHFTGVIENVHDDRTIAAIRIRAILYGTDGRQVNTAWGYADSDRIPPGGTSTYSLWVDLAPGAANCRTRIESAEFTD